MNNDKEFKWKMLCSNIKLFNLLNKIRNVSYDEIVLYMYQPTDPSSLGIIRFLFGLLMLSDLSEERGGADLDKRWENPRDCHFPLFHQLTPCSFHCMSLLYCLMWIGALGIALGYKFQLSMSLYGIPYWYILLLDKSYWNNHSYLFGIITLLLMGSSANHCFSLDGYFDESKRNKHVPYWNYFILKYQFFLLYFLAGLKKTDMEWLEGYSMKYLGDHWVFMPLRLLLSSDKIDYLIVHWFGFLLDLTIGFWMMLDFTRPVAMLFCALFHFMNSRLFSIGMFPYVCLATMPLFCEETWPRKIQAIFSRTDWRASPSDTCIYTEGAANEKLPREVKWRHKLVVALLISHCGLQLFLPYSHFITKGYNNWTKGLYGYSWDMMVHSWDTIMVVVKVVDNETGQEHFIDSHAWTQNERWSKHADMCVQYAQCLKRNLDSDYKPDIMVQSPSQTEYATSRNISVYVDVWCSLNKRFQQRMYDPTYDLLKANWSPFRSVEWLLPVLTEYNDFRSRMNEIAEYVYSWSNQSDVLFIADFPGLSLENFIDDDLQNVTLTVLEGEIAYELEDGDNRQSFGVKLTKGEYIPVEIGVFHRVHTISETPSCYMYTFVKADVSDAEEKTTKYTMYSPFPFLEDVPDRADAIWKMWKHIAKSFVYFLLEKPLDRFRTLSFDFN